jgi:plastocyanin
LLIALFVAVPAMAAPVAISVIGADGKPLADAVVIIEVPGAPAAPVRGPYVVAQRNIAFVPHISVVPVGATVSFPNQDKVRHHVYSFSKAKRFDLKLYGREESRSVLFDKPGVVALGCNIHDVMSGFIYVTPSPFAGQTDASGHLALPSVPPGKAIVRVWHPSIHAPDNTLSQAVVIGPSGYSSTFTIHS